MLHAVKMADGRDDILEGLGIPSGGPHNGRDVEGEYFTKSTDLCLDWFGPGDRPLLYHHGLDADAQTTVVGRVTDYKAVDAGTWTQVQLDRQSEYFDAITQLVKAGKLYFSSGAMAHLVQRKKSGEITRWPWIELSLTPTPANLLAELDFATAEKHFDAAGVKSAKLDELKATLTAAQKRKLPDSDFAYIDSDGGRHLPMHDEAHVRAALSRFNQTQFESPTARAAARRKLMARAKKLGVDVSDKSGKSWTFEFMGAADCADDCCEGYKALPDGPTMMNDDDGGPYPEGSYEDLADDIARALRMQTNAYAFVVATFPGYALVRCADDDADVDDYGWPSDMAYFRVSYDLDADGEPQLGEMEKVEPAMIPAAKAMLALPQTDEAPLAIHAARLTDYAALVADHTKGVHDRRTKEGRVLSEPNRARLAQSAEALEGSLKAIRDLLSNPEPQTAKAASEDRTDALRRRQRDVEVLALFANTLDPAA